MVRIFEEVGGRPFEVRCVAGEALSAQRAGATASLDQWFALPMLNCLPAGSVDMRRTLEVFPMTLTSVRDYAARVLGGH